MRIIAGELRSRKLVSVRGMDVRPTADRLRESLFNILSQSVSGKIVLDLFAGTGALGIEALSRGAQTAVFIDYHKNSVAAISQNLKSLGIETRARLIRWDIRRNLNCIADQAPAFDLVFMDPPYDRGLIAQALRHLSACRCLRPGAEIVAEHSSKEEPAQPFSGGDFLLTDQRKYGRTVFSFLRYEPRPCPSKEGIIHPTPSQEGI